MKYKQKKFEAFTLIEILVVISLTLFLIAASTQAIVGTSQQFSFANVYQKVDSMIRQARSLAVSGKAELDYIDFNNNGCYGIPAQNVAPCALDAPADYVTPANFGVYFEHHNDNAINDLVVLFADNHVPSNLNAQSEKKFDYNLNGPPLYEKGFDQIIEKYELPTGIKLQINPIKKNTGCNFNTLSSTCTALFYSPVFADVSVDPKLDAEVPFFYFGVFQNSFGVPRKHCEKIHKYTGNPELILPELTNDNCEPLI